MEKLLVGESLIIIPNKRLVLKDNIELNLSELSYRLLIALVQNSPKIVSHDELMKAVWPDRVVSDENLKKRISRLRESLGDSSDNPKYFIAERGLGYRCISTVKKIIENSIEEKTPNKKSHIKIYIKHKINQHLLKILFFTFILMTALAVHFFINSKNNNINQNIEDYEFQAAQYYYRFNPNDNDKARELYQKSIEIFPNKASIYSGLSNVYSRGFYQFGKDTLWLQNAIKFAKRAVELEPNKPWGYQSLGFAYYLNGRFTESINLYKQASKIAPNWGIPLAYHALVLFETGSPFLAYSLAQKAIQKSPNNPEVMTILSQTHQKLSRLNSSKTILEKSLELNPDYLLSQSYLAELALIGHHDSIAQKILKSNLLQNDNSQLDHWLMAHYQLKTRSMQSAQRSFEQVALLGGRYSLAAQVYISVINNDKHQIKYLKQQVENTINNGNQWPELKFLKGLLLIANNETTLAINELILAVESGFTLEYRYNNLSVFLTSTIKPEFKKVLDRLVQKNRQNRLKRVPR